jgi:putative transposase
MAHVILPDHLHWLVCPSDGTSFSDLVAAVKRNVTWRLKDTEIKGPLWQKRFYDHIIRDPDDLARHLDYVHYNPVKHGYAVRPMDYPRSSFAQWLERGVYSEDWGAVEPERISGMDLE